MTQLLPRQPVPALTLPLVGGGTWDLAQIMPGSFTMIAFYRGLHCPICKGWLGSLHALMGKMETAGISVVAASMESEERATRAKAEWSIADVPLAYGMDPSTARAWGLYLSTARPDSSEPPVFSEPGLMLVRPDRTLYCVSLQSMPFTRPAFSEVLDAVAYVQKTNYPARGELAA